MLSWASAKYLETFTFAHIQIPSDMLRIHFQTKNISGHVLRTINQKFYFKRWQKASFAKAWTLNAMSGDAHNWERSNRELWELVIRKRSQWLINQKHFLSHRAKSSKIKQTWIIENIFNHSNSKKNLLCLEDFRMDNRKMSNVQQRR